MSERHLSELQEGYREGSHKAAAAACGCAGNDEVHHLLTCQTNLCLS